MLVKSVSLGDRVRPLNQRWEELGVEEGATVSAEVWDGVLKGHTDWVFSVAPLEGGKLASGSGDKTIRIWDLATGACERVLEGHTDTVYSVVPLEGGRLASASADDTIRIWDLPLTMVVYEYQ